MNRRYQVYLTDKEIKLLVKLVNINNIHLLSSLQETITIKRVTETLLSSYIESDLAILEYKGAGECEMG